jgi:hypothetical protein
LQRKTEALFGIDVMAVKNIGRLLLILLCCLGWVLSTAGLDAQWVPDHIVIVILENRSFHQIIGDPNMPCLNALARGGALMTQSYFSQTPYAIVPKGCNSPLPCRPSQPNYLYLFSGHHQGVTPEWFQAPRSPYLGVASNDSQGNMLRRPVRGTQVGVANNPIPADWLPLMTPNLGAAIINSGRAFASFSESLPHPHYEAAEDPATNQDFYRRKHNPVINWINFSGKQMPAARRKFVLPVETNLGFLNTKDPTDGKSYRGFAVDEGGNKIGYDQLPTVSIVVPNEQNDLHSAGQAQGDAWLLANIQPYADWAKGHNSLLIITFDEDGAADDPKEGDYRMGIKPIATIFFGPDGKVAPGLYDERIDHLNVLSTILDRYGLLESFKQDFFREYKGREAGLECANLRPIRDVFGEGARLAPNDLHLQATQFKETLPWLFTKVTKARMTTSSVR